jgi:regulator of PEP synthase PpsR (kinase-PPPase family)
MREDRQLHLHLISDSTGETLNALACAALAPFPAHSMVEIHLSVFVRSARDLEVALKGVEVEPGLVWYTVVDPLMCSQITETCGRLGVSCTGVLNPLITALTGFLDETPSHLPGLQHRMTSDYFERIAALDYAISHDDGAHGEHRLNLRLRRADVILVGISRTSKTPTCIYLAYRGIKAANVPLVPNRRPPHALFEAMAGGVPVIGLTASPTRLAHVRSERLGSLGHFPSTDYADLGRIRAEVADARIFFERHRIPVIDVTRRSIEETAGEILAVLRARDSGVPRSSASGSLPGPSGASEPDGTP